MKLRLKYFLVLVAASLIPMTTVTWISWNASRRLGQTISGKAEETLTDTVKREMVRTARSYAAFSLMKGESAQFALKWLAATAASDMAHTPPPSAKIYYATDFDDPSSAPDDLSPSIEYTVQSGSDVGKHMPVSFQHPGVLLAPGTAAPAVADEIARIVGLGDTLKAIKRQYGSGLVWVYVSLESGVHLSYPGHGGYPAGYDPRTRSWYVEATRSTRPVWHAAVDATTRQLTLTLSMPFFQLDGSLAGVVGMDIKSTHDLLDNHVPPSWFNKMSSFIIGNETDSGSQTGTIWAMSSRSMAASTGPPSVAAISTEIPELESLYHRIKSKSYGYLDMPFQGVDSLWAYASMLGDIYFVIVVPKSEIMTLPEEVGQMVWDYSNRQAATTGIAFVLVLIGVGVVAFFASRFSTRHIITVIDSWKRIAGGDFAVRLEAPMKDERAHLVHAFNEIVPKIAEHMRMKTALGLAQEVQQSLLPERAPPLAGFDLAGTSIYCDETGGDYYDFITTNRDGQPGVAVVVGDVSGHGASAALLMATARALVLSRASNPGDAAQIINDVNRHLCRDTAETGNFMTMFYGELSAGTPQIGWVRAGHDPALLYDPETDAFDELVGPGMALGLDETYAYGSSRHRMTPGQVLLIGTDGIWELRNPDDEMFGKQALMETIRRHSTATAQQIISAVTAALAQFRGHREQEDDITLVVVKVVDAHGANQCS